jgi:hypothetical protein
MANCGKCGETGMSLALASSYQKITPRSGAGIGGYGGSAGRGGRAWKKWGNPLVPMVDTRIENTCKANSHATPPKGPPKGWRVYRVAPHGAAPRNIGNSAAFAVAQPRYNNPPKHSLTNSQTQQRAIKQSLQTPRKTP